MDKLVKRVTTIRLDGENRAASVIYRDDQGRRKTVSAWSRPLEKVTRKLLEAQEVGSREALRLHEKSNGKRRDGWLIDGPKNTMKANRKAYNVVRKAVPAGLLPKA